MPKKKTVKKKPAKRTAKKRVSKKSKQPRTVKTKSKSKAKRVAKPSSRTKHKDKEVVTEISFSVKPNLWLGVTAVIAGLIVINLLLPYILSAGQGSVNDSVVQVTYLYDESCSKCYDVTYNSLILQQLGLELDESFVSINSAEGAELISKYNITKVPTFILSPEAVNNDYLAYIWLEVGTVESDGYLVFRALEGFIQAEYDESNNFYDLSNIVDYVTYKDLTTNETGMPLTTDSCAVNDSLKLMLFAVSECPWCKILETEILPNLTTDFPDIIIEPHYLFYELSDGSFASMHGEPEYEENLRQICADEEGKWLDYTNCINANNTWDVCVNNTGLNLTEFNDCYNSTALTIAESDAQLAIDYAVTGTPTMIFDCNLIYGGDWTNYTTFKQDLCSLYNSTPVACNN